MGRPGGEVGVGERLVLSGVLGVARGRPKALVGSHNIQSDSSLKREFFFDEVGSGFKFFFS